ncbi:MAG: hypothetical protein CUN55_10800 [Phototrophicales bacterium]|nr:MAG: hypothetical protein CUN55_10800 [Phototrophicales bacterium]
MIAFERLQFYFKHSFNDLIVNGRRTIFGLFCISAGVAATIGLLTLGNMVQDTLKTSVKESNRGDIRITPAFIFEENEDSLEDEELNFTPQELGEIKQWFADQYDISIEDLCQEGSPVCVTQQLAFSGTFINNNEVGTGTITIVYAIDTDIYPLYGVIEDEDGNSLAELIDKNTYHRDGPADVVLSQQLADELEANVGDPVQLFGVVGKEFVVSGIVPTRSEFGLQNIAAGLFGYLYVDADIEQYIDPAFLGDSENTTIGYSTIYVALRDDSNLAEIRERFEQAFPQTDVVTTDDLLELNESVSTIITQFNSLMGLLALLIGGIGIVNTMLVIVRRRTSEIAILKTLGLKPDEISILFLVEAILMGILGSVFGIPLGFVVAYFTQAFVEAFVAQDLIFRITLSPILIGLVVGTTITTIFGLLPTLAAGQVRPATVLQPQMVNVPRAGIVRSIIALMFVIVALSIVTQGMLNELLSGDSIRYMRYIAQGILFTIGGVIGGFSFSSKETTSGLLAIFNPVLAWGVALFSLSQISTSDTVTAIYIGSSIIATIGWFIVWLTRKSLYPLGSLYLLITLPILGVLIGHWLPATLGILGVFIIAGIIYIMLWFIVWLVGTFLPSFRIVELKIAMRSMLAVKGRVASTLLAFIIGVFTLSLVVMLTTTINKAIQELLEDITGGNIIAFVVSLDDETAALNELENTLNAGIDGVKEYAIVREYNTQLVSITDVSSNRTLDREQIREKIVNNIAFGNETLAADNFFDEAQVITARSVDSNLPNISVVEGRQLTPEDMGQPVIVLPKTFEVDALGISVGDIITYQFVDANNPRVRSAEIDFEVVGLLSNTADIEAFGSLYYVPLEFLPDDATFEITPASVAAVIETDEGKSEAVGRKLRRLDNVFVLETRLFNQIVDRVISNFTSLPIVVLIVVVITGGVVIANSVMLSMLERRREIAIMKTVGLQRRRVLFMLLLENGIMGFIAGIIAVGLSSFILFLILVFAFQRDLGSAIPYQQALLLMLICISIAVFAAMFSIWGAASEKPLKVLRYE